MRSAAALAAITVAIWTLSGAASAQGQNQAGQNADGLSDDQFFAAQRLDALLKSKDFHPDTVTNYGSGRVTWIMPPVTRRPQGIVLAWMRSEALSPEKTKGQAGTLLSYYEYDCVNRREKLLQGEAYPLPMMGGAPLSGRAQDWDYVIPGTVGAYNLFTACSPNLAPMDASLVKTRGMFRSMMSH